MRGAEMLAAIPATAPQEPPRVALVVDDDALVRDTVAMQLESDGWTVFTAPGIADARAVLSANPTIAVVVCDIHLASESGFDVVGALAELRPEQLATEVIFITGNATSDTAIKALRHQAFDLIRKPLRRGDLVKRAAAAAQSADRRRQQQAMLDQIEQRLADGEATKQRLAQALRDAEDQNRALTASADETRIDLLAVISHELKTPLVPIVGFADIMLNSSGLSTEEVREFAGMIRDGGEHLNEIIDRSLAYLDAERQQAGARTREFPLAALIDAARDKLPRSALRDGSGFEIDCPAGLHAWGAPELLSDALAELLDNALKASPAAARVQITARRNDDGHIVVDVTDVGPGLPDSVRNNIGVPFLQGDATLVRHWDGVGLGLACARKIARLNGGELQVAEPQPDTGARLRLILCSAEPA